MPRLFFRFPSKDQPSPQQPPPIPPKSNRRKVSQPEPPPDTIRTRRVTSPTTPSYVGPVPGIQPAAPKHRASASDSLAQGAAWRQAPIPLGQPNGIQDPRKPNAVRSPSSGALPRPLQPGIPQEPRRQLRRSKGHQPIADEIQRRGTEKVAVEEPLQEHAARLKREINEETIRLTHLRQKQQAIREERKKVEKERELQSQSRSRSQSGENISPINFNLNGVNMPKFDNISNHHHANPYGKSQSTPALPQTEWTSHNQPPLRGRSTAQSRESFQSASSQEQEYRRISSRTPSMSSNDRSPPPQSNRSSHSPPNSSQQHWQRLEQARKEREKEKALARLIEARELERKAFEEAWSMYDSRWMLLNYATRASAGEETKGVRLTLTFVDIPWPLLRPPRSLEDINTVAIRRFLASDYHSDRSPRERIKDALLRWHPDRFGNRVLDHVREDQREEVRKGVDIVVRCLNELLAKC